MHFEKSMYSYRFNVFECLQLADELTAPRPEGEEKVEDIQVLLTSDAHAANLRELKVKTVFLLKSYYSIFAN